MKKNLFLAIIPARGGSKGIKKKNIIEVCGKPLIDYTIRPVLELVAEGIVDTCIVSTDDTEIADVSKTIGADVPFLRPAELSTDNAKSIDLMLHAIDFYEKKNINFDAVILLQPTCPLRTREDILEAINIFNSNNEDSLISVYKEEYINDLVMYKRNGNHGVPFSDQHNKGVRRQDHGASYVRNGAIYITTVEYLKTKKMIISDIPLIYEMPKERSMNIDTESDLNLLRNILCR